jgi:hypothetical protein
MYFTFLDLDVSGEDAAFHLSQSFPAQKIAIVANIETDAPESRQVHSTAP